MKKKSLIVLCAGAFMWSAVGNPCLADNDTNKRDEIAAEYKWNFSDIYPNWEAWEADLNWIRENAAEFQKFKGHLSEGPEVLIKLMNMNEEFSRRAIKVYQYVGLQNSVDSRNQELNAKLQQVGIMFAKLGTETSWISPEMLQIPEETMKKWIAENPELKDFKMGLLDMYRLQKHVLSADKEVLLSYYSQPSGTSSDIYEALSVTDMEFPKVTLSNGEEVTASPGEVSKTITMNTNQEDRRKVSEALAEVYYESKNTYAAILNGVVQSRWAGAQARNYASCLDATLEGNNIPKEVYLNLIKTAKENTAPLQRYYKLRKKILGLEKYYGYDGAIGLVDFSKLYPYEEAKDMVYEAMAPLGQDYQSKLKKAVSDGWLDVYEYPGKRGGAFSSGVYGVHPYMLLNYNETLDNVFTLAHELGHTMHTLYSDDNQPFATHDYTIFVAEVASTFNERLLLDYMLEKTKDPKERIVLLNQAIDNIVGTFYRQAMFADFEYQVYTRVEQGQPLNAEILADIYRNIADQYYGDAVEKTEYGNYVWSRISHFYTLYYYVYQYATSFAASSNIYEQIANAKGKEAKKAVTEKYLNLLKSGGNDFPMEQLKKAGVDLSQKETILAVVNQLDELVTQLEKELEKLN